MADPTSGGNNVDKDFVDELDEEIKEMREEINALTESVSHLQKHSLSSKALDG